MSTDPRISLVDDGWQLDELTPTTGPYRVLQNHERRLTKQQECLDELRQIHRDSVAAATERTRIQKLALRIGLPILVVLIVPTLGAVWWIVKTAHANAVTVEQIQLDVDRIDRALGLEKAED